MSAILVPSIQCTSPTKFFHEALSAWIFLGSSKKDKCIAGVRIMIEGIEWPIIMAFGSDVGFQTMCDTTERAKIGRVNDLHVQVRCMTK